MKKIFALAALGLLLLPSASLAFTCPDGTPPGPHGCVLADTLKGGTGDLITILDSITNWVFTIFMVLAVIFVTLAAYKYLMSQGGEEVGKAHKMLMYAAIAVAVAILAKGIVTVAVKLVTPSASSTSQQTTQQNAGNSGTNTAATNNPIQVTHSVTVFCQDGTQAVASVDGKPYNGDPSGKTLIGIHTNTNANPNDHDVLATRCADGTLPTVTVDGTPFHNP